MSTKQYQNPQVKNALMRTWETIASDLFASYAEDGIYVIKRSVVIETVLDAGRLEEFNQGVDFTEFRALPFNEQEEFAKTVFVDRNYR